MIDVSTIFRGPRRNSAEEGDHKISCQDTAKSWGQLLGRFDLDQS